MDIGILYAGLSAVTDTELITPSEAAARNITSKPIAIDHVFEYTYKPVRPTFQLHLQYPPREWVDLKVKTVTGAATTVFVKKNDTLAQVKEAIEKENESLPAANQRLVFNMKQLSNDETVESIGIEDGDTIEDICDHTMDDNININVKTVTGAVIQVQVHKCSTITQVKDAIEKKNKSLTAYRQRLVFNKRLLSDEDLETLESIGIKDGDTIEDICDHTGYERININVETTTGAFIVVQVCKNYTIAQVKDAIEKKNKSLKVYRQRLVFNKRLLSDDLETLQSIGIKDRDTIEDICDHTGYEQININVETTTGALIFVQVGKNYTIAQVKDAIEKEHKSLPAARQKLVFNKRQLYDKETVQSIGIKDGDTLFLIIRVRGGGPGDNKLPIVLDDNFLHPKYDYDFTRQHDDRTVYMRGGEVYHRPYGWYRHALKVLNKYEDNTWLGERGIRTASTAGEWPVSYHGTTKEGAEGIASEGYDINRGRRQKYGKGIYSTPDLRTAERYAKKFTKNGKWYKIVLQNRVNPDNLQKPKEKSGRYWLVSNDSDIRPYGVLIKEI